MRKTWSVHQSIDLTVSAHRLFDYLRHWDRIEEWDPSVVRARPLTDGRPTVGSRYDLTIRFGWSLIPVQYTITALDTDRRLELLGEGPSFRVVDRILVAKIPSGSRLAYTATVQRHQGGRPLSERVGKWLFERSARKTLQRLKTLLMGTPRPPSLTPLTRLADRALLPGLVGFTRLGFALARRRRPIASALFWGRTVVLTGGTSGIGRAAARQLYEKGVHLVVVGRDPKKLEALHRELHRAGASGNLETEMADLSRQAEVRRLAQRILNRHGAIDVLINNAGALFNRHHYTADGIERSMAVNLVSPYLLTRLLRPALQSADSARIINVASGGMYTQAMHARWLQDDPARFDGPTAYARAKRGLVLLTEWWAKEMAPWRIGVHAMHPGWVDTPGLAKALPAFHRRLAPLLRTPDQGADTIVWLTASPDAGRSSGRFWLDRKIRETQVFRHTRSGQRERWALVDALDALCDLTSAG